MMKFKVNACDGVYDGLDVRFTNKCDNDCLFCSEKAGVKDMGKRSVDEMIKSTIESKHNSVLILGGEPLLMLNGLLKYCKSIRTHVDTLYLTTSLPKTVIDNTDLFNEIMSYLDGINVSIQSTNWEENNEVLRASNKYNRLEALCYLNTKYSDKIRVNLNITKDGINSKYKLFKSLQDLQALGCKEVKITEMQNSNSYVSYEEIMGKNLKSPYTFGCQHEISLPFDMRIILKRSCFLVEKTLKANSIDLIKSILKLVIKPKNRFNVMYESGIITKGWLKNANKNNN